MASNAVVGALRVVFGLDASEFHAGLKQMQSGLRGVAKDMERIGKDLSVKVSAPLLGLGGLAIKAGADFEAAMNRVGAATGANASEFEGLSSAAREMGRTTRYSATEAAEAIEILAKNGLSSSDILGGALSASLQLAASSGANLADAGDLATDVMLNFGKAAGELEGVVDGVTGVLLASKFGIDDYRLALAQAGGVAGGLGVSLEDFNAAIAATSNLFASGSDAGTSFKTFLQNLVPKSAAARAVIYNLGLEFFDTEGRMRSMAEIAQELQDGFAGLSDEARSEALSTLFGTDAMRTAIGLMDQGAEGIREISAAIDEASAQEQADARMKGFTGSVNKLKSAFEGVLLAIADSGLLAVMTQFADILTDLANRISAADPALIKFGVVFGSIAAAMGPVLVALGAMAAAIAAISAPVALAVAGIVGLTAAVVAFWPEIKKATAAIGDWWSSLKEGGGVSGFLANAVQAEIDILKGMVSATIDVGTALIEGLQAGFTDGWAGLRAWIGQSASDLIAWFKGLFGIASPSTVFAEIGGNIIQGLFDGLMAKWEALKAGLGGIAQGITSTFKSWLGIESPSTVFAEIGRYLMEGLGLGISGNSAQVTDALQGVTDKAQGTMAGLLSAGEEIASGFGNINSKMLKTAKIFGAAQALISTYQGAAEALKMPFPTNLWAAAKVMAAGLGFVGAIKGVSAGGGGRSSVGSSGGSGSGAAVARSTAAAPTSRPLDVRISGIRPDQLYRGDVLSSLLEALMKEAGTRGIRVLS